MTLAFPTFNRAKKAVQGVVAAAMISVAGTIMHIARANLWRDAFNPLRGLTMRKAVAYLEEGERGAYADLQWVYRFIEKRDATLRGGKRSLIGGVEEKDWDIRTCPDELLPPGCTKTDAESQAKKLREHYDRIDNLRAAIAHLALAEFRGFAHLEKHYATGGSNDGAVTHLEPVEQWYLCRDGLNGAWMYNDGAVSGQTRGTPIDLANWIIREIEDPIDEIALIAFVRKNLSQKDWDGYIESFGIPSIFVTMPPNVPSGKEKECQATVEKIVSNSRGALPHGSDLKSVTVGQTGTAPFEKHLTYQNEQIVLAITSGLLTMLAESGSGTLAGGAHTDTFDRIVRALAKRISETFQEQFDKPILAEEFPEKPILAWFEIAANEEEDTGEFIKNVKELNAAGYKVEASQIEEKTGLKLEEKPEIGKGKPESRTPLKNRRTGAADPVQSMSDQLGVPAEWNAPVADLWRELIAKVEDEAVSDADLLAFIEAAAQRIPELWADMDVESLAGLIEGALGASALQGLRAGLSKTL